MVKSKLLSNPITRILIVFSALFLLDYFFLNEVIGWFFRALFKESTALRAYVFFGCYLSLILTTAILLLTPYLAIPTFLFSLFFVGIGALYSNINREPFGLLDIETALRYFDFASQAVETYWRTGLKTIALPFLLYSMLFILIRKKVEKVSFRWLSLALLGVFAGTFLTVRSAGSHVRAFPRYLQPAFIVGLNFFNRPYIGPRDKLYIEPTQNVPRARHIIMIMDESVRADLMSINGYNVETTPFLKQQAGLLLNFGVASSLSNSSSSSNYGVLTGMKMRDLPDKKQKSRRMPLIFDYANSQTPTRTFLWAQTSFGPQKQKFEFNGIDTIDLLSEMPSVRPYLYDRIVIDKLDDITKKATYSFTWVNKRGSHFDYDSTYPIEKTIFKPTYKESNADDQAALLNSYYNSLRWGVDQFFKELFLRLKDRDIIVVYTSDHGQSILENGIPGTHNRTYNISWTQASVPIMVMGFNSANRKLIESLYLPENKNRTSAEQIFPTLLYLLGYSFNDIQMFYAPSLFEKIPEGTRVFLSGDMWGFGPAVSNVFLPKSLTGPNGSP